MSQVITAGARAAQGHAVTFCFTDMEGSTRLARALGARWYDVLARHNAVLRAVWQEHCGEVVATEGDGSFVVFADAGQAVAAAAAAQFAIMDEPWPELAEVRVRIGLHTGRAAVFEGGWAGTEVHRAARVCAAGHGGQVLLSRAAAAAAAPHLPPGAHLVACGDFRLKDFEEGERLHRLSHPRLRDQRVPRALPLATHNLPRPRTSFVGRDQELIALSELLESSPLVTVLGAGGTGKTRLSIEVARLLADVHREGCWAVLLAGLPAGGPVAATVARSLAVADQPGLDTVAAIVDHLRHKELLVLLDNCEHVLADVVHLVEQLLDDCPGVRILVTSRQPLLVAGEQISPLGPLATDATDDEKRPAAVQLFVDRAKAVDPLFALTAATELHVRQICAGVDGLPLAIELAAAATRYRSLTEVQNTVTSGGVLPASRSPALEERQRSLDALVAWSYALLDPQPAEVFRRLSVFRGGWTAEAAAAVSGHDGEAIAESLADLTDRSLISRDLEGRYRMLVIIRAFAERTLGTDPKESGRTRMEHVEWAAGIAERVMADPSHVESQRLLVAEYDNLLAAREQALRTSSPHATVLTMAVASRDMVAGQISLAVAALRQLEPQLPDGSIEQVRLLLRLAAALREAGELDEALALCHRAEAAAQSLGDEYWATQAGIERGYVLRNLGGLQDCLELAESLLTASPAGTSRGDLLRLKALALAGLNDSRAWDLFGEAAEQYLEDGRLNLAIPMLLNRANRELTGANPHRAARDVAWALVQARELQLANLEAAALCFACRIKRVWPHHDRLPAELLDVDPDAMVQAAERSGVAVIMSNAYAERCAHRLRAGEWGAALADLRRALPVVTATGETGSRYESLILGTCLLAGLGHPAAGELVATAAASHCADEQLAGVLRAVPAGAPAGDVRDRVRRLGEILADLQLEPDR